MSVGSGAKGTVLASRAAPAANEWGWAIVRIPAARGSLHRCTIGFDFKPGDEPLPSGVIFARAWFSATHQATLMLTGGGFAGPSAAEVTDSAIAAVPLNTTLSKTAWTRYEIDTDVTKGTLTVRANGGDLVSLDLKGISFDNWSLDLGIQALGGAFSGSYDNIVIDVK
jgi:hypothetical protein